jgi:PTH1 family peptidyl-tRNA hydrolase
MIELAAFLGNPGPEHEGNRHNAGRHLARKLPFFDELRWRKKFKGQWADIEGARLLSLFPSQNEDLPDLSPPGKIHFIMPETYMNRSGDSIHEAASFFKIMHEQIMVIHDELELPLGTISLKLGGGLGGHNGLRSMKANFGTPDFWRLRIGIGRPDDRLPGQGGREGSGRGIVDWVLSDFSEEELSVLEPSLKTAADLLIKTLVYPPEDFLPLWSKRKVV